MSFVYWNTIIFVADNIQNIEILITQLEKKILELTGFKRHYLIIVKTSKVTFFC